MAFDCSAFPVIARYVDTLTPATAAAAAAAGYARILVTASVATWVSIQGGLPYGASKVGCN
jgi:hypothetical protein